LRIISQIIEVVDSIVNPESNQILILQPHLMKNLKAKFRDEGKNKRVYKTSRTSKLKIVNPENDEHIIEPNLQSQYRSDDGIHKSTHFTIITVLRNSLHQ
jgi:hypothetical protein